MDRIRNLEALLASGYPSTLFGRPVVMRDSVIADEPKPRLPRRREILRDRKVAARNARVADEIGSWRGFMGGGNV